MSSKSSSKFSRNVTQLLHDKFAVKRFDLFAKHFANKGGTLLDLGGGNGSYLGRFRNRLPNYRICIADIKEQDLRTAKRTFGFETVLLNETDPLPFGDREWDLVFCNSVIEHRTGPKEEVLGMTRSGQFTETGRRFQWEFAKEIRRISKSYFLETPNKFFPIESHTMFPFVGYVKREMQVEMIRLLNSFWIKKTTADWLLLDMATMVTFFPDAKIEVERFAWLPKSLIAIKSSD